MKTWLCNCLFCQTERAGKTPLISADIFCASCGHGYIDLRTGRPDDAQMGCQKCGSKGQWVTAKSDARGANAA